MNDPASYVAAVLSVYRNLPDTPLRPSAADQSLATLFFEQSIPCSLVESALLLGSLRRLIRPPNAPPLTPIRSLAYFRPVVEELRSHPLPEGYATYLRLKLYRVASGLPANTQKTTFSDDR